ncbi:MAG: 3'-5' exonuclease [Nocardioidaceae bacterium]
MIRFRRRWPGPDDSPWREAELAVVDLELTGLDPRVDEIISIGVTPVRGGRIAADRYYRTVRPVAPIGPDAAKIHALTVDELASSPPLPELLDEFREQLRGKVLVAHAAFVERAFLDRAFAPVGERLPRDILDTAPLARAAGLAKVGQGVPQLEALARDLGLPVHTPHHALGDALTTAQVFLVLAARLEATRKRELRISELARLTRDHAPD